METKLVLKYLAHTRTNGLMFSTVEIKCLYKNKVYQAEFYYSNKETNNEVRNVTMKAHTPTSVIKRVNKYLEIELEPNESKMVNRT